MDDFKDEKIQNAAHKIIYSNIYEKFLELKDNKKRFLDDGYKSYGEKMTLITENYEDSIRGVLD